MITTGGYQVNVLPQPIAVDPRLYALNPQALTSGALQGMEVVSTLDRLKAERAHQEELAATRAARIAQIQALSHLDVLSDESKTATQPTAIQAEILKNQEAIRAGQEAANTFNDRALLEKGKLKLEGLRLSDQTAHVAEDSEIDRDLKRTTAARDAAHAAYFLAEVERAKAEAAAKGVTLSPEQKAWLTSVGSNAADLNIPPQALIALSQSSAVNERGEPLRVEAAKLLNDIKKPEFAKNPFGTISQTLKSWLVTTSPDALNKIEQLNAERAAQQPEKQDSEPVVSIGADGKVRRVGEKAPAASAPKAEQKKEPSSSISTADALAVAAPALSNLKGLGAELAGKPISVSNLAHYFPQGAAQTARAVGLRAIAPASVAYGLNNMLGKTYSNHYLGNLEPAVGDRPTNLSEGLVLGMNQPSTSEMVNEAKYDDLTRKIHSLMRAYDPSDENMVHELTQLLDQRNAVWSMLKKD